jgi:hypothetical protein
VNRCLLHPEELPEDMSLADLQALYESIWRASGFKDTAAFESRVAEFDNALRSPEQENILLMMKAFPGLLPDTINSWQPEKIIYHIALARIMLNMDPLKLPERPRPGPEQQLSGVEPVRPPAQPQGSKTYNWQNDLAEWKAFERS